MSGIIGTFIGILAFLSLSAAMAAPAQLTYQGRIVNSDGTPLESASVSFEFTITSPSGTCILYKEQLNGIDMRNSKGVFDTPIGSGTRSFPSAPGVGLLDVFSNSSVLDCAGGATFTPSADDGRKLRVQFHDGVGWKLITPDNIIRTVPYAAHSANATKLSGKEATDFVLKTGIPLCPAGNVLTSASSGVLTCTPDTGGAAGIVNSILGSGPITASDNGSGVYTISASVGTAAGTLAAGNDSRIVGALQSGAAAGGDLSGTYPNPAVAASAITTTKINDAAVTTAKIADNSVTTAKIVDGTITVSDLAAGGGAGHVLRYSGAAWVSTKLNYTDLVNSFAASPWPASCPAGQFVYWSSASDAFACSAISNTQIATALGYTAANQARTITAGTGLALDGVVGATADLSANRTVAVNVGTGANQIPQLDSSGKLASSVLPTSVSDGLWTVSGSHIYRSTGNVGLGVASPQVAIDVQMSNAQIRAINSNSGGTASLTATTYNNSGNNYPASLNLNRFRGTLGTPGPAQVNDQLAVINVSGGHTASSWAQHLGAKIQFNADETFSSTSAGTSIGFHTQAAGGINAVDERMHISSGGQVGIGMVSSSDNLQVRGKTGFGYAGVQNGQVSFYPAGVSNSYFHIENRNDNTLKISTGATPGVTDLVTIQNGGNVGIGVASPSAKLDVNGTVKATAFEGPLTTTTSSAGAGSNTNPSYTFTGDPDTGWFNPVANTLAVATGGNERLRIDSTGSVGIGTTNPLGVLHLSGSSAAYFDRYGSPANFVMRSANGTSASPTQILSGDVLGRFAFAGYTNAAAFGTSQVGIHSIATENWTAANNGMAMTLSSTPNGGTAAVERLRVDQSGYVGIGISAPTKQLEVASGTSRLSMHTDNASTSVIRAANTAASSVMALSLEGASQTWQIRNNGDMASKFSVFNSTSVRHDLTITPSGNVGIGNTDPGEKLVIGNHAMVFHDGGNKVIGFNSDYDVTGWTKQTNNYHGLLGFNPSLGVMSIAVSGTSPEPFSIPTFNVTAAGHVGIGTIDPQATLDINGYSNQAGIGAVRLRNSFNSGGSRYWQIGPDGNGSGNFVVYNDNSVGAYLLYGQTAWSAGSDRRLKKQITPIEDSLNKLLQVHGVTYRYNKDKDDDPKKAGVIAQEIQAVLPEAVTEQDDGFLAVKYTEIIPLVINAVKELYYQWSADSQNLHREIASVKAENVELKAEVTQQKEENAQIKNYLCAKDPSAPFCR